MSGETHFDVVIVGGGAAGLSAGIFTARHDFRTIIVSAGSPILRRNAHLENYPGFPAGVSARLLLDMMATQARDAGCEFHDATVTQVRAGEQSFQVTTDRGDTYESRYVIAATKNDVGYLQDIDDVGLIDRGKQFVDTTTGGRTGVEGLYAAGRLAEKPHQAIVAAGHGAEVAIAILEDDQRPFYHDWVAPAGYFTGRDRDVPPGCEEIDDTERIERESQSLQTMQHYFADLHPDAPEQHPSVE